MTCKCWNHSQGRPSRIAVRGGLLFFILILFYHTIYKMSSTFNSFNAYFSWFCILCIAVHTQHIVCTTVFLIKSRIRIKKHVLNDFRSKVFKISLFDFNFYGGMRSFAHTPLCSSCTNSRRSDRASSSPSRLDPSRSAAAASCFLVIF